MAEEPTTVGPLSRTLRRGAAISAVVLVATQVLSFAQTLVLARLLDPAQLGVYTAGTVLTVLLITFSEGGMRAALIHRSEADLELAAVTALWASLISGVVLALLCLAAAPVIAAVFGDPRAGTIAAVTSGVLALRGLATVPDALMQRRFAFRRRLVTDPGVALGFLVVAVPLCALGYGVWGLVGGLYGSTLVGFVSAWALAGWWPRSLRPSWRMWRELAHYSFPLLAANAAERAREALESTLTGRWLGAAPLGLYRYGRRVGELPGRAVVEIADYVLFPAFARIAGEAGRFRSGFLRALRLCWTGTVPMAGLLVALGTPAVVVVLGERWRGAGIVVETMAGWGPGVALASAGVNALKSAGRTRQVGLLTASTVVLGVGLLAGLVPWLGLAGVGLTVSIERLATGALSVWLARPLVGARRREILAPLWAPVVAGVVATAVVAGLEHGLLHADQHATEPGLGLLVLDTAILGVVYLLVLRIVRPAAAREIDDLLAGVGRRLRRQPRTRHAPRVLWVSTSRTTRGGVATYVEGLAASSLWGDWRVRHVPSHVDGSVVRKIAVFGRSVVVVLATVLRRRTDLVHLHAASRGSFVRKATLLWLVAGLGVPVVLHVHGGRFAAFHDRRGRVGKALVRRTLERADRIVALGECWAAELRRLAPGARVVAVGNAVRAMSRESSPEDAPPRVVCLGRVGERKGHDVLLDAWSKLERGDARLVVAGDGDVEAFRHRADALGLAGSVEVHPWLPHADAQRLLAGAAALALPSRAEGQPMVVLEAMALGVCVVASAVGGIPDLVEDGVTGVLVPAGDAAALTSALHTVLHDRERRERLARAGRERARAEYDTAVVAARLDEIYRSVLAGRG